MSVLLIDTPNFVKGLVYGKNDVESLCHLLDKKIRIFMWKFDIIETNIVFCYDCFKKDSWRRDFYSEYKNKVRSESNNKCSNNDIMNMVIGAYEYLIEKYSNASHMRYNTLEADDIIAIAVKTINPRRKCYILSNDNDMGQCLHLNPNCEWYKITEMEKMQPRVYNNQYEWVCAKVLMGDNADNLMPSILGKSGKGLKVAVDEMHNIICNLLLPRGILPEADTLPYNIDYLTWSTNWTLIDMENIPEMLTLRATNYFNWWNQDV